MLRLNWILYGIDVPFYGVFWVFIWIYRKTRLTLKLDLKGTALPSLLKLVLSG